MRKILAIITAFAAASVLSACSSGGDGRDCIDVPAEIMDRIAEGANGVPITPIAAGAVIPEGFSDATIIAMSFDAAGNEAVGTWLITGTVDNPGLTMSVDAMAESFTDWPSEYKGTPLRKIVDGKTEAKACIPGS